MDTNKTIIRQLAQALITGLLSLTPMMPVAAQTDSVRVFTEEHPLVYEDAWDLWPYVFLNEHGEPTGYNIDLLKVIFKEMKIPYVIKLKPTIEALEDLKAGRSDLMLGMDAHFHNDYAKYGKSVIQLFTHSVLHHKDEPERVKQFRDLSKQHVIVHDGSFSHHLMMQHGWGQNAIPYDDMQEAVQKVHLDPTEQIVWNTLSLKWLIRKYKFDELTLSPVDMQHGEYKFMSNNPRLLQQLDSVYTILRSEDRLLPMQNKWFYPERQDSGIPAWVWKVAILLVITTLAMVAYYLVYRVREKQMTKAVKKSNKRLSLILNTSKVRITVINVATKTLTTYDQDGNPKSTGALSDYAMLTTTEDFKRLRNAIHDVASQKEKEVTLYLTAKDSPDEEEMRDFVVTLSVLHRDEKGHPTDIISTRSDITDERLQQKRVKDTMLRYQIIFNSAMIDMVSYDEHGYITDMNQKSLSALPIGIEEIREKRISVKDVLELEEYNPDSPEYVYMTQLYDKEGDNRILYKMLQRNPLYYELQLTPVHDNDQKLIGIFGTGRNVTEIAKSYRQLRQNAKALQKANDEMSEYISNIDFVLKNGGVRMANYSPVTHTLTIYGEIGKPLHRLTQTRALNLTSEESKRMAQRVLNSMDNLTTAPINAPIKTSLRVRGGMMLSLYVSFIPVYDEDGRVKHYFGMCRDISEIKTTEELLARETVRAQEVETVKNAFLHNMSYQIRTPLNTVVGFAELFQMEHNKEDEAVFINEIKENSAYLLKLINDILFLSRLDARMIEFKTQPTDFAAFFEPRCQTAFAKYEHEGVKYTADNPYHKLVIDIDMQNLGIVIDRIMENAAKYTEKGSVRARYDYNGEQLVIACQDTGCGIPEEGLKQIFERFASNDSQSTGLSLSICYELVKQMDGRITFKSEVGRGTIVWITIPCKVIELERK